MKRTAFLLSIGCALVIAGCDRPAHDGGGGGDRVAQLEKQVTAMKDRDRDLRTKMAARSAFPGGSPLDDFFASPEFWQCTYDSAWSDCASRCTKATSDGYKACLANHPPGPARVQCVEENSRRGSDCLRNCPVQTNPTEPPLC